ncbi:RNI-like protein [Tuber magnatum]|uniref:RNI-like protein n=1 Tax=Tuber magnatum TaxID=42249 RepID=A0A317T181_9PEZI|nr:RNI-like protein [Tuber magnatum]
MSIPHDASSARRRSFAFFSRPSNPPETDITTWPVRELITKQRPKSAFFTTGGTGYEEVATVVWTNIGSRPKIPTKTPGPRPRSMFVSSRGRDPGSPQAESSASSSTDSSQSDNMPLLHPSSRVIIHSGEVVSGGGLLRRKKEFMVLTTDELLRYKSESKASEAFGLSARSPTTGRTPSIGSAGDLVSEHALVTVMNQVVAVYRFGCEGELACSVQVDHLDGCNGTPSSTILQVGSSREAQEWLDILRQVSQTCRSARPPLAFPDSTVKHIARRLEADKDYSPAHLQIFRTVQRCAKVHGRAGSSEDLHKMYSTICYLVIGIHKVHFVPLPKCPSNNSSSRSTTSLLSTATPSSHGILNLVGIAISDADDSFTLTFRTPCRPPQRVHLASTEAPEIIRSICQASEYLRPNWLIPPFSVDMPQDMKDEPTPEIPPTPGDDYNGFDRTLSAYCKDHCFPALGRCSLICALGTAYDLDASNIVYGIHTDVEDSPRFVLYPPAYSRRRQYTDLELLAVMRSLRWNEAFTSLSFRGINLESLHRIVDTYGTENEPNCSRSGRPIGIKSAGNKRCSLLIHEIRALALCSSKLRRLDVYECMKRKARREDLTGTFSPESGCGIVEAVMPLCRRGLTNCDWFDLTGIELVESDLDWLVDAAASRLAHFRGFELARCGLTERMMTLFLNALATHENTLESLNLCGNPGRIHAPSLNNSMSYFPFLRKLSLSRLLRTSGEDPLLTAETLLRWRLEDLDLSETKLNKETIDAVAAYLASPQSDSLHHLTLTQCGLTSRDVAVLMGSMSRAPGKPRHMHLYVGQNPLSKHHDALVECILSGTTPSHLTMRMVDYPKEEMFREFVTAMTVNKTIRFLDISKVSLPYEAGQETCAALGALFAKNSALKELDISGEQAVLESASLGAGLISALSRLSENKTLEILRIELQSLGTPGAMGLASMLTKNTALKEIHCEMNEIHLQGFSAMVNAMEQNKTVLYLPRMDRDRVEHVKYLKDKLFQPSKSAVRSAANNHKGKEEKKEHHHKKLRRLNKGEKKVALADGVLGATGTEQSLMLLDEKWESETQRLLKFLTRNARLYYEKHNDGA